MDKKGKKRRLTGKVVSDKMAKTVVVLVNHLKMHKKYKKQYRVSKKYKAHDADNEYRVGDQVIIEEIRPWSREKRWQVIKKL